MAIPVSRLQLFFAFVAICLSPIYIFSSGNPQPTDMAWAMFVMSMLLLSPGHLVAQFKKDAFSFVLVCLGAWVVFVSIVNAIYYNDGGIFLPAIYYVYNILVAVCLLTFLGRHGERYRKVLITSIVCAVLVVLLYWSYDVMLSSRRAIGPFNNPNQLAYFSLLMAGMLILLTKVERLASTGNTIVLGVLTLYLMSAASLTALAAFFMVALGLLLKLKTSFSRTTTRLLVIALLLVPFFYAVLSTSFGNEIHRMLFGRVDLIERKIENVGDSRGYNRILEYPEHVILGAGERGRDRFGYRQEIHSSFATMLFSYGVVGLMLFLAVLWLSFIKGRAPHFFILLAPALYSLTHQGLRFTLFWVFLVIVYWTSMQLASKADARRRSATADRRGSLAHLDHSHASKIDHS
ncbi:hypothetical protein [Halomonas heilongjiangensis]|uniref:O-antigen ligase domain-containing protein n=1 Tax=Halomonas heilongjiangensis TaxID=1387883 RepID=A0A2N7TUL6_9GAMM|nr:hypothetical protein [Halomonas heilongjiangensis]PMR71866.1 hypothetical protein C1H66_01085 [Halomonas heilongjiangensis]PXX87671.1 hypothetical protein CR158_17870 [Halomonas heilongjiangensis]